MADFALKVIKTDIAEIGGIPSEIFVSASDVQHQKNTREGATLKLKFSCGSAESES
jgi:hypothetical protein